MDAWVSFVEKRRVGRADGGGGGGGGAWKSGKGRTWC